MTTSSINFFNTSAGHEGGRGSVVAACIQQTLGGLETLLASALDAFWINVISGIANAVLQPANSWLDAM